VRPLDINEQLMIKGDVLYTPGDKHRMSNGKSIGCRESDVGVWAIDSRASCEQPISAQIEALLEKLEPHFNLLGEYALQGHKMDFFCGYSFKGIQPGLSMPSNILGKMGEMGIDFELCLYDLS